MRRGAFVVGGYASQRDAGFDGGELLHRDALFASLPFEVADHRSAPYPAHVHAVDADAVLAPLAELAKTAPSV